MLPMLASDWCPNSITYPKLVQPKIDGVRGLNLDGRLTGRSLREHNNTYVSTKFSNERYLGFDGELVYGIPTDEDLCRKTSALLNSKSVYGDVVWYVFDLVTQDTLHLPYSERYLELAQRVAQLNVDVPNSDVVLVPQETVTNSTELLTCVGRFTQQGYEGTIVRDPCSLYKSGRATTLEGSLLRIKDFVEEDAIVTGIIEQLTNTNTKETNLLGRAKRSSSKSGLLPTGLVGSLVCVDVKTGKTITVNAGKMTRSQKKYYFDHQDEIIGSTVKYKYFAKGSVDKPRLPTFQSIRPTSDLL